MAALKLTINAVGASYDDVIYALRTVSRILASNDFAIMYGGSGSIYMFDVNGFLGVLHTKAEFQLVYKHIGDSPYILGNSYKKSCRRSCL